MRTFISFYFLTFLIFPIGVLFCTSLNLSFAQISSQAFSPVALCTYQLSFFFVINSLSYKYFFWIFNCMGSCKI